MLNSLLISAANIVVGILILAVLALFIYLIVRDAKTTKKSSKYKNVYSQLYLGMSKQEVFELLGTPSGQRLNGDTLTCYWRMNEFKGWIRGGTKQRSIIVDFADDKVIGFDSENMGMSAM